METRSKNQSNGFSKTKKVTLWSRFTIKNDQHMYILSLCRQYGWTTINPKTGKEVADIKALDSWMRSAKCPVQKPLLEMTPSQTSKIISALENMVYGKHKKG